jgi:hypothetical protein
VAEASIFMNASVFEVRRSRPFAIVHAVFTAALLGLALLSLWQIYSTGEGSRDTLYASAFFSVILSVYFWTTVQHGLDREPLVVVTPEGLRLRGVLEAPIPWSEIRAVAYPGGLRGRHRVDLEVTPEIRIKARLGSRWASDPVVGRSGSLGGISIVTQGLDARAPDLLAAIRRYWPPPESEDEDGR